MKVVDVEVRVVQLDTHRIRWHRALPDLRPQLSFVTVTSDDGLSGHASAWLPGPLHEVADGVRQFVRPLVVGRDVRSPETVWHELQSLEYFFPLRSAVSAVDIASWDLAARTADLPLHRLLGSDRDTLPAYASLPPLETAEDAVSEVRACLDAGFGAVKLHTRGQADADIALAESVRDTVGPGVGLMLDPVNGYDRRSALRVAKVLERLEFRWLEAPLPDDDVAGYRELRRRTTVPLCNGEVRLRGLRDYRELLDRGAVDIVRYAADVQGGITGMRKVAVLCEAHGVPLEVRSYGSALVQAAHLHGALSLRPCGLFEVPVPRDWLDFGMIDALELGPDGKVTAPPGPGLGLRVDWDAVEDATVAVA